MTDAIGDGQAHAITITNSSPAELTGITVLVRRHFFRTEAEIVSRYFYDCLLNTRQSCLASGESHVFDVGSDAGDKEPMQSSVEAAIFSNGTATGEVAAIKSLWARRRWLVVGYGEVFKHIEGSVQDIHDREATIQTLTQLEGFRFGPTTSREERGSVKAAYDTVIENLKRNVVASPSEIIATLRERESARAAEINRQLAPLQLLQ